MAAVLAVLFALAVMDRTADAEIIYNIDGVSAPTLKSMVSSTFVGSMVWPSDTADAGILNIEFDNEPDVIREVPFEMSINMPGNPMQPWDTRMYVGMFEEKPMMMTLVDFDMEAGNEFSSLTLADGGGWDGWSISFNDYPIGSVYSMTPIPSVNEPAAAALAAFGFVIIFGMIRGKR